MNADERRMNAGLDWIAANRWQNPGLGQAIAEDAGAAGIQQSANL